MTAKEQIILTLQILSLITGFMLIVIGLIQNKKSQTGISALSGGNQELFAQTKERGLERTLSILMFSFGLILFSLVITMQILQNVLV